MPDSSLTPEQIAEERIKEAARTGMQWLDLSELNLMTLPESIGELSQLQVLNIRDNHLDILPESIGQLSQLQILNIPNNRLVELPESIGGLSQLQVLSVRGNRLLNLPESIGYLSQVILLDVQDNNIVEIPISINGMSEVRVLNVSGNNLRILPSVIGELNKMLVANFNDNDIVTLPDSIGSMSSLRKLYLKNNGIISLNSSIGNLSKVNVINVRGNKLIVIPETIGNLSRLQELDVRDNQLRVIPMSIRQIDTLERLYLNGNPALNLPPEVLGPNGEEALHQEVQPAKPSYILEYYFRSQQSLPLNEAKLILVGRGAVGKTSLVNQLVNGKFDLQEKKTDGISITPWELKLRNEKVRLNIWDFGGQEIMHATHQFFLTQRSLYLLVVNAREGEQDANIEYWLRIIESFGAESPVLVVINKIKDHAFDLNRRGLREKFPMIRGFIQTDCEQRFGIDDLRNSIERETVSLEHLRDPFPSEWFRTKEVLRSMEENVISYERYCALCRDNGVVEPKSQDTLVGFLHNLGIVLNFKDDPRLRDTHVLNPEWVTNGIYKMLNAGSLSQAQGVLNLSDLEDILDETDYHKTKHGFLIDLMQKFELCFRFDDSQESYLIPELLDKEEPQLEEFKVSDCLLFQYHYNILPEGLMPRFIVRTHGMSQNLPRWRTGVALQFEGNRALVKADVQDRKVYISVIGNTEGQRRLLTTIRSHFDHIHHSIPKLQATEMVPVPLYPDQVLDYRRLLVREANGKADVEIEVEDSVIEIPLKKLLDNIDSAEKRARRRELESDAFKYNKIDIHPGATATFIMQDDMQKIEGGSVNISGGTFTNSPVAVKQKLENSYNTIQQAPNDELKMALKELAAQVEKLLGKTDEETSETAKDDLENFAKEATKKKPRHDFLQVTGKGLIEAARTVAEMTGPITLAVEKVIGMLPV